MGLQFGGFRALVAPLENPDLNLSFLFPALGAIEGAIGRPTATPDHKKHGKGDQKWMQRISKVFPERHFAQYGKTMKNNDSTMIFMVFGLSGEAKDLPIRS